MSKNEPSLEEWQSSSVELLLETHLLKCWRDLDKMVLHFAYLLRPQLFICSTTTGYPVGTGKNRSGSPTGIFPPPNFVSSLNEQGGSSDGTKMVDSLIVLHPVRIPWDNITSLCQNHPATFYGCMCIFASTEWELRSVYIANTNNGILLPSLTGLLCQSRFHMILSAAECSLFSVLNGQKSQNKKVDKEAMWD